MESQYKQMKTSQMKVQKLMRLQKLVKKKMNQSYIVTALLTDLKEDLKIIIMTEEIIITLTLIFKCSLPWSKTTSGMKKKLLFCTSSQRSLLKISQQILQAAKSLSCIGESPTKG